MSADDRLRWDAKYAEKLVPESLTPDEWLIEQVAKLPPGRALELACGLGHNAIWLAQHGWQVDAVDISHVGLRLAEELARRHGAAVRWTAADLDTFVPDPTTYELVVVFRFLDRARLPRIIDSALAPGGRLVYETFTKSELTRPGTHMKNPDFALDPGELPRLFPSLAVVSFSECQLPERHVARLVARPGERGASTP